MDSMTQMFSKKGFTAIGLCCGLFLLASCQSKTADNPMDEEPQPTPKKTAEEDPALKTEAAEKTEKQPVKTTASAKGETYLPPVLPSDEDKAIAKAIEEIEKLGGKVQTNRNGNVDKVDLARAGEKVQDGHLVLLQVFPLLDTVDLTGTSITDEGLKHLKGLEYLRYLYLLGTDITDQGVAELRGHSRLEWLCLDGTKVTDAGVKHLEGLGRLVMLHLVTQGEITDACIDSLVQLKELKELKIEGTQITEDGRARLEKALPEIQFIGALEEGIPID
jgi:hypothetical protein